jgi:hypothetical protein
MVFQTNLSGAARMGYAAAGVALAAWGFFGAAAGTSHILWYLAGAVLVVEALAGY